MTIFVEFVTLQFQALFDLKLKSPGVGGGGPQAHFMSGDSSPVNSDLRAWWVLETWHLPYVVVCGRSQNGIDARQTVP